MRKRVMTLAWVLKKKAATLSFADCLRQSWRACKARAAMKAGQTLLVRFVKSTGEVVERTAAAFATPVKGTGRTNPATILYHDVTKDAPGSFRADRLVSFIALKAAQNPAA